MKNVLITGASGGIGGAIAQAFAERGYGVALGYNTNREAAERLCDRFDNAVCIKADVSDEAEVERLFDEAEARFGFMDTLVNCAGISKLGLFTEMSLAEWNEILAVNLTSVFLCSRRALRKMIAEKRGSIVNVSSIWGKVGASCEVAYSASKAGVIGLTKALAKEEGPSGIRVNCVAPGMIDTQMNGALSSEAIAEFCKDTALGRQGSPEEVAAAAVFLAESSYVTGQTLMVDGFTDG